MNTSKPPVPYQPAFEHLEDDEAETQQQLVETLLGISEKVHADEGHAFRSVHAKSHGVLRGTFEVLPGLPPELAQGVCAHPASYPFVLRLSTTPGDLLEDSVSTPRGLALKLVGVTGERLPGSEGEVTQDFVMVNGPVFSAPTAKRFLKSLKLLAATTDHTPGLKKALSAALRGLEKLAEKAGHESATLKSLGGHPATHPLGETYFTQVPLLWGPYMAKLSLAPVSPGLLALKDAAITLKGHPDALREAVSDYFAREDAVWELRVQLCTDTATMPLEDASVEWPQDESPYVAVARITAPQQAAWEGEREQATEDALSFSPWHGIAAHRPLGSVMRIRRAAYAAAARFRNERNATPVREPRDAADLGRPAPARSP